MTRSDPGVLLVPLLCFCVTMQILAHLSHTYIHKDSNQCSISLSIFSTLCRSPLFLSGNVNVLGLTMCHPCPCEPLCEIRCSYRGLEAEFISNASLVVVLPWTNKRLAGERGLSVRLHTRSHTHTHVIQKHAINTKRQICRHTHTHTHKAHVSMHVSTDTDTPFDARNTQGWRHTHKLRHTQ